MIRSVLINLSFLVSCLCAWALLFGFRSTRRCISKRHPRASACLFGVFTGASGILLSLFSIPAGGSAVFDFHCIFLLLAGLFGNPLSLAVCAAVQMAFRSACAGSGLAAYAAEIGSILFLSLLVFPVKLTALCPLKKWCLGTALCIPASLIEFLPAGNPWYSCLTFSVCLIPASAIAYTIIDFRQKTDALLQKFRRESTRDYLTGLNNVRRFDEMFNAAVRISEKRGEVLSLLMCDIDYFKKINDRYGHRNGDAILVQFSRILQRNFPLSVISRNGGEEFTVLLRGFSKAKALSAAERLRSDVEQFSFCLVEGGQIHLTISVGEATCNCSEGEGERLLERADTALYTAKRSGRNKVSAAYSGRHAAIIRAAQEKKSRFHKVG